MYFHKVKSEEIGYFRKANFLIPFFEGQIGDKIGNLRGVDISKEDVNELLRRCNIVLNDHSKAEELLPTECGFFYGSTDYDEYYFEKVASVRDYIKETLLPEFDTLDDNESIQFEIWY